MSRTAYEPLPRIDREATLARPELDFGHPLPSLTWARISLFLSIMSAVAFGLSLLAPSEGVEVGVSSWVAWFIVILGLLFIFYASASIFAYQTTLPLRRVEQEKQNQARVSYIRGRLLPFLESAYGVAQIANLPALLQGSPTNAIRDGKKISVVILQGEGDAIELGDGSTGRRIEDDSSAAGGGSETAVLLILFPYSIEHMVLTGDGSLHSTVDGGSFDASSGDEDGGGDGD